jgi:hypothetical protein
MSISRLLDVNVDGSVDETLMQLARSGVKQMMIFEIISPTRSIEMIKGEVSKRLLEQAKLIHPEIYAIEEKKEEKKDGDKVDGDTLAIEAASSKGQEEGKTKEEE